MRAAIPAFIAVLLLLAACHAAPGSPTIRAPSPPAGGEILELLARSNRFDAAELRVPAGQAFVVRLRNEDREVHNFELRDQAGNSIFRGQLFSGPGERLESLTAVPAGTYQFLCTAHPFMKGTLHAD